MHGSLVSHNIAEKINFVTKCNCVASPIVCVGASLGCKLQPRYAGSKRLTTGAVRLFIGVKLQGFHIARGRRTCKERNGTGEGMAEAARS